MHNLKIQIHQKVRMKQKISIKHGMTKIKTVYTMRIKIQQSVNGQLKGLQKGVQNVFLTRFSVSLFFITFV